MNKASVAQAAQANKSKTRCFDEYSKQGRYDADIQGERVVWLGS